MIDVRWPPRGMAGPGPAMTVRAVIPGAESPDCPRRGRRRPAIHDCPSCIKEVVDGRPSPAMTGVGNVRQYFRPPVSGIELALSSKLRDDHDAELFLVLLMAAIGVALNPAAAFVVGVPIACGLRQGWLR